MLQLTIGHKHTIHDGILLLLLNNQSVFLTVCYNSGIIVNRVVTKHNGKFQYSTPCVFSNDFHQSCFIQNIPFRNTTPNVIITKMREYDKAHTQQIIIDKIA